MRDIAAFLFTVLTIIILFVIVQPLILVVYVIAIIYLFIDMIWNQLK